jgi:hypothetical protein
MKARTRPAIAGHLVVLLCDDHEVLMAQSSHRIRLTKSSLKRGWWSKMGNLRELTHRRDHGLPLKNLSRNARGIRCTNVVVSRQAVALRVPPLEGQKIPGIPHGFVSSSPGLSGGVCLGLASPLTKITFMADLPLHPLVKLPQLRLGGFTQ